MLYNGLHIPSHYGNMELWEADAPGFVDKLHNGDPSVGWEGDRQLGLYHDKDRWMIARVEDDGRLSTVHVGSYLERLDERILIRLMDHDRNRGFDPVKALDWLA